MDWQTAMWGVVTVVVTLLLIALREVGGLRRDVRLLSARIDKGAPLTDEERELVEEERQLPLKKA